MSKQTFVAPWQPEVTVMDNKWDSDKCTRSLALVFKWRSSTCSFHLSLKRGDAEHPYRRASSLWGAPCSPNKMQNAGAGGLLQTQLCAPATFTLVFQPPSPGDFTVQGWNHSSSTDLPFPGQRGERVSIGTASPLCHRGRELYHILQS